MERDRWAAASVFRPLWTACGESSGACETTSFMSIHLFGISRNFVARSGVDAALRCRSVRTHAGGVRNAAVAPAVEACGGVGALGEGQEGARRVRRCDEGGQEHAREDCAARAW